jgi:Zn-dependent oligopeptidase
MRVDVFKRIEALFNKKGAVKNAEDKRLLSRMFRDCKRNGLNLSKEMRDKIEAIQKRMSNLSTDYSTNSNEENRKLEFSEAELAGTPEDYRSKLTKAPSGKYLVSLSYPDYFPIMKLCEVSSTRQQMERAFNSRNIETNVAILEELVVLRAELAEILGYKTHADKILDIRMAKSASNVKKFLNDLGDKMRPLFLKEREALAVYKQKHEPKSDGVLQAWDGAFYRNLQEKDLFSIDQQEIKKYFPANIITKNLLELYEHLLHLKFTEVENP